MKRFISKVLTLLLVLAFSFSFVACQTTKTENGSSSARSEASLPFEDRSISEDASVVSETSAVSEEKVSSLSEASEANQTSKTSAITSKASEKSSVGKSEASSVSKNNFPYKQPTERTEAVRIYLTTAKEINKEKYVDCAIKIEDPSGQYKTLSDEKGSIKIRGNSTSDGAKKPYNIKFSSKTDVLGMGKAKKWALLANMFDKTLIRNKMVYDFAATIGMKYTSESTFADVYLNGKYVGCYQLCESVEAGSSRVDIDTDGNEFLLEYEPYEGYANPVYMRTKTYNILLGFNDPEEPTNAQKTWLANFMEKAEAALDSREYDEIAKYWDIDSMIDDYIVHEYFKCVDACTSSARYYIKDGKIHGGPVWDFDLSTGNANPDYYTTYYKNSKSTTDWWVRGIWYGSFIRIPWFHEKLVARFQELQPLIVNLYADNELGKNRIDYLIDCYGASFDANYNEAGWPVNRQDSPFEGTPRNTYAGHIKTLKNWLKQRNDWMKEQWDIQ